MSAPVHRSYRLILEHEEEFARRLGVMVLEEPALSVWMILIPILLLLHLHRIQQYRTGVREFAVGILQPRRLALDSAVEEAGNRIPAAGLPLASSAREPERELLRAQEAEGELLRAHYRLLLRQDGGSYGELVRMAYPTRQVYRAFLGRLAEAEADVGERVLEAHHPGAEARQVVERMREANERLREEEIREIFG